MKDFLKLGQATINVIVILFLISLKAFCLLLFYTNGIYFSFFIYVSSYIDLIILKNPLIYCQQKEKKFSHNLNSFRFLGSPILTIFLIFSGSVLIPFLLMMCLRNFSSFFVKSHFLTLIIKPVFLRVSKTILKWLRYSFQVFEQIIMLSSQTRTKSPRYFLSIQFIRH